jgi:hypothetical protein
VVIPYLDFSRIVIDDFSGRAVNFFDNPGTRTAYYTDRISLVSLNIRVSVVPWYNDVNGRVGINNELIRLGRLLAACHHVG